MTLLAYAIHIAISEMRTRAAAAEPVTGTNDAEG